MKKNKNKSGKKFSNSSISKTLPILDIINKFPDSMRRKILKKFNGNPLIHKSMRELSYNYLKGNVKTTKKPNKNQLSYMRNITKKENRTVNCHCGKCKSCNKQSKEIQKGGSLLPLLIPAVATIVSSLISRK